MDISCMLLITDISRAINIGLFSPHCQHHYAGKTSSCITWLDHNKEKDVKCTRSNHFSLTSHDPVNCQILTGLYLYKDSDLLNQFGNKPLFIPGQTRLASHQLVRQHTQYLLLQIFLIYKESHKRRFSCQTPLSPKLVVIKVIVKSR